MIDFKQFNQFHITNKNNFIYTNFDERLHTIESIFNTLKPKIQYTYLYESKTEPKLYFRSNYYLLDSNTLLIYMDDITKVIENDKKINISLEKAIKDSKDSENAKAEFFARMSHDMRTPMTAILALIDFSLESDSLTEIKDNLTKVKTSSTYLLALLNDVLDIQSSENNLMAYKPVIHDNYKFVKITARIIAIKAKEKNINFKYNYRLNENQQYLIFDNVRTRQLFLNILNNSIKYTHSGGSVLWDISGYREDNKLHLKYIIKDNGVGMSQEFQQIMFDKFSREYNPLIPIPEGSGLGLSIAKKIVDAWGGNIECESTIGKGTILTINLTFPIANELEIANYLKKSHPIIPSPCFKDKKILIVEDIKVNTDIIIKLLEQKQIVTTWTDNGLDAISLVKEDNFDLIIMDIRMPVLDGIETTKLIREFNKSIPIIALSANAYQKDIEISLDAGMNEHLSKPIDRIKFYQIIEEYLYL